MQEARAVLTTEKIEQVLKRAPSLTIGVLGDLFLDRYLDLDAELTEPSIETSLDAYQVVRVRSYPGAAGTVLNNLVALGVGRVIPIAFLGDDGEGYELRQALQRMPTVNLACIEMTADRRTPTYTKPMLMTADQPARELNRLDIKNRTPMSAEIIDRLIASLDRVWESLDALIVLDQVAERDCGVVTGTVREALRSRTLRGSRPFMLADSRNHLLMFQGICCVKPNGSECARAMNAPKIADAVQRVADQLGQPVFATMGPDGMLLAAPHQPIETIPGFPVVGPVDPVGAGDCVNAAIATAIAAGLPSADAAGFACLAASVTVQQIGTTGTASPDQIRERWQNIKKSQR
jgi:rfaE bifunctional protein kinase chain/domain